MQPIDKPRKKRAKAEKSGIGKRSRLGRALKPREQAFCREAARSGLDNAATLKAAYARAGYAGKSDGGPARLLNNARVRQEIARLQAQADRQAVLTLAKVEAELARVGFADVPEEAITGASKVAALAQLAKHLGVRERIEVSGSISIKADDLATQLSGEELEFLERILERLATAPGARSGSGEGSGSPAAA